MGGLVPCSSCPFLRLLKTASGCMKQMHVVHRDIHALNATASTEPDCHGAEDFRLEFAGGFRGRAARTQRDQSGRKARPEPTRHEPRAQSAAVDAEGSALRA